MTKDKEEYDTDDILRRGREAFERCESAEQDNRMRALEDVKFARLGEQWPEQIEKQRRLEQRPCLTINKMPAFIRQVVNDARQNKPQIKVHPVDSQGDPKTAKVIDGLIRNIEYTSDADTAYDTAIENSVSSGVGYWRIGMDYAFDDTFDMDLTIERVANTASVYGDPDSMAATSKDWNTAFVIDRVSRQDYKARYEDKENVNGGKCDIDFQSDAWNKAEKWLDEDNVILAEWWTRKEVERTLCLYAVGQQTIPLYEDEITDDQRLLIDAGMMTKVPGKERKAKSHKVTQTIMSGADVLEVNEWPGKFIPIVPVYGDEIVVEGKRYFVSLIHNAIDAQRMFNYWRTAATELVALAPKVPFIGRKGTFDSDSAKWATANTQSHSYLEFDGEAPIRLPLDSGPAAGALQEALNASDDMKAIIGLYDASLGARSNETSGVAINARKSEGDVATFHFIDNLTRAIRHTGRILIDLIPHVYTDARVIRVVGEDGVQATQPINQPVPEMDEDGQPMTGEDGNPLMGMRDLTAGKYDLTVTSGPSFTTRREEAAVQITEVIRAFPQGAPVLAPLLAKNSDWPGADEIERELKKLASGQLPPEVQSQIDQGKQELERLTAENQQLKMDQSAEQAKIQAQTDGKMAELAAKTKLEEEAAVREYNLEIRKQDQQFQLKMRELEMERQIKEQANRNQAEIAAFSAKHKAAQQESRPQG